MAVIAGSAGYYYMVDLSEDQTCLAMSIVLPSAKPIILNILQGMLSSTCWDLGLLDGNSKQGIKFFLLISLSLLLVLRP